MFKNHPWLKSVVVITFAILFLIFLCVRNIENRLEAFYKSHHFNGEVQITSLGIDLDKPSELESPGLLKVGYIYSEEVEGRRHSVSLQLRTRLSSLMLPALDLSKNNLLDPLIYKGIELGGTKEEEEKYFDWLLRKNPVFSQAKANIKQLDSTKTNEFSKYEIYTDSINELMKKNRSKGHDDWGGAYGVTTIEALEAGIYYVQVDLPYEEIDEQTSKTMKDFYSKNIMLVIEDREQSPVHLIFVFGENGPAFRPIDIMLDKEQDE